MLLFGLQSGFAPDQMMLLFMALAFDAALGEMRWLFGRVPHPVVLMGALIAWAERRFNRGEWSETRRRRLGILVTLLLVTGAFLVGLALSLPAHFVFHAWPLEVFVAATLFAQRSLFEHVDDVAGALEDKGLEAGRYAVSRIVGRDPATLDEHGVARAAIESLAENFSDAVVAPAFWYVLLGLPGLFAFKMINTLDSMIGHRSERYRAFGWAAARLDDGVNLIPARLSGLFIVLATIFAVKGRPARALVTMLRDARHHRSPNSGWPEAAMAGALDLALGGPRKYPGLVVDEKWIGQGRAKAEVADIKRALHLFGAACLLHAGAVVLLFWLGA